MEWLLEILSFCLLLCLIAIVVLYWSQLPQSVPIHFSFDGHPDNHAPKIAVIYITAFSIILYATLTIVSKLPHTLNYLWPITQANASSQYLVARQFLTVVKLEATLLLFFCEWSCIQGAIDKNAAMDTGNVITLLLLMIMTMGIYVWRAYLAR